METHHLISEDPSTKRTLCCRRRINMLPVGDWATFNPGHVTCNGPRNRRFIFMAIVLGGLVILRCLSGCGAAQPDIVESGGLRIIKALELNVPKQDPVVPPIGGSCGPDLLGKISDAGGLCAVEIATGCIRNKDRGRQKGDCPACDILDDLREQRDKECPS